MRDSESKVVPTVFREKQLVLQEHHPVDQKVMGSIPSQGTCVGCRNSEFLKVNSPKGVIFLQV